MGITSKQKNAINTVINNGGICYPRELATAELTTAKSVKYPINGEIYDVTNIKSSDLSSKKFYEYSARYGFVFDLITAICTEHPDWIYDDPNVSNYVVRLSRSTCEQYALDGLKGLSGDFWENVSKLAKNPESFKNIPVLQADGKLCFVTTQPVIVSLFREDIDITTNSKNANLLNLNNIKPEDIGLITTIEIQFFKPLFRGLMEKGSNWIALPKAFTGHLIKLVERHKDDPAIYGKTLKARPSVETLRKAIMYLNMHESSKATTELKLNLVDFCLHVLPSELDIKYNKDENGELYVRSWSRVKEKIDLIFYLFNCLHREDCLKGFKFTTGNSFVSKANNNIWVAITRDNNTVLEYKFENPDNYDPENIPF